VTVFDRGRRSKPLPLALSDERKHLVHRYMTDALVKDVDDVSAVETLEPAPQAPQAVKIPMPTVHNSENGNGHRPLPDEPAPVERRPRRGRPPGRKARRQVHFHVDPDEDRLLLSAAGRFGSQQKGLIAALNALEEVGALREQVKLLEAECARQRQLLAEAEAVFNKSRAGS
jgi:hypothetical protein